MVMVEAVSLLANCEPGSVGALVLSVVTVVRSCSRPSSKDLASSRRVSRWSWWRATTGLMGWCLFGTGSEGGDDDEDEVERTTAFGGDGGLSKGGGALVVPAVMVHGRGSFSLPLSAARLCRGGVVCT